jgi:hypothetical protein
MRSHLLLAGLAAAAVLPATAMAQETCQERAANRAAGTVAGAVAGALVGGAIAGHDDRAAGAVVGGVAGGVLGNQLAKGPRDCDHAYGWYDNGGRWHATGVTPSLAAGYYDRSGAWIDGPPPGYSVSYGARRYATAEDDYWLGYPELADRENHIRGELKGGVRDGTIRPDTARDLMRQLGDIQVQEAAESRRHGPDLPYDERQRLQAQLDNLDRQVDRARGEP